MSQLPLGTVQKAQVIKKITEGFMLSSNHGEFILPDRYVDGEIELNQDLHVFIFPNKKGQAYATMTIPEVRQDSYGWAEVDEVVKNLGVFVTIGLEDKEVLVSKDDLPLIQTAWPEEGDFLFVSLEVDKRGRLLAVPISEQEVLEDIEEAPQSLLHREIMARVYRSTKAGSFVLTEEGYRGFIHPNERKQEPRLGETIEGRVIDVKDDGTVNISLLPLKQEGMKEDADLILEYLEENDGVMHFTDKSDPEEIRNTFRISKAAFKRALGKLMKESKVEQKEGKTTFKH